MDNTNKIIWQPNGLYQKGHDEFSLFLDRHFAKEMLETKISQQTKQKLNQLGSKLMNISGLETFQFFKDTAFVNQFYLGENGLWLALDVRSDLIKQELNSNNEKPLKYYSHNCNNITHAHDLMKLVDFYTQYSEIIKEAKIN
jgi:hypothetical protein